MDIPFINLDRDQKHLRPQFEGAIKRVLDSSRYIGGPVLAQFEQTLASHLQVKHAVGVSSGTDALLVSLMALEIGPNTEVITTPFSFFATAGAIARLGAKPVFADIEANSFNLDPQKALNACTSKTRAIIPVDLYGRPATRPPTQNIPIVQDAAQSIGATKPYGNAATLSFFPTKNLGAFGDGGAVLIEDSTLADRVRLLRNHGAKPKYYHSLIGGNFRLDPIQAALLAVKLPHLDAWTQARRRNATNYRTLFAGANIPCEIHLPGDTPDHIYNQFVIRCPRRDQLRQYLAEVGIETEIYYPLPFHLQPCFAHLNYKKGDFPHAERAAEEALALPIYPSLQENQQQYIVEQIRRFYTV